MAQSPFLPSCIPKLEFHDLRGTFKRLDPEIHANRLYKTLMKLIVDI